MKLVTGRVENGKVSLPEGEFEEGAAVAVLASTMDEPVRLTPAEEEALIESLAAIRSGKEATRNKCCKCEPVCVCWMG